MKLNTAPVFMHFPAKGKPKKGDTLDIHRYVSVFSLIVSHYGSKRKIKHIDELLNVVIYVSNKYFISSSIIKNDNHKTD